MEVSIQGRVPLPDYTYIYRAVNERDHIKGVASKYELAHSISSIFNYIVDLFLLSSNDIITK